MTAPEGSSYDYMDNYVRKVADLVTDSVAEKETILW